MRDADDDARVACAAQHAVALALLTADRDAKAAMVSATVRGCRHLMHKVHILLMYQCESLQQYSPCISPRAQVPPCSRYTCQKTG